MRCKTRRDCKVTYTPANLNPNPKHERGAPESWDGPTPVERSLHHVSRFKIKTYFPIENTIELESGELYQFDSKEDYEIY